MYVDGLSTNILYLAIMIYFIFIISIIIVNIKNLLNKKYIPLAVLILIIGLGLFLRNYDPTLLITSSIISITNLIMYFTILNPDINMLEEISQNRELIERNNEDKSNLMFKISCDLKSPIKNLINLSDTLLKHPDKVNKLNLKKINNELKMLLFILNNEFDIKITSKKNVENIFNTKLIFNEIITIIKHNNNILFNYEIKNVPNYLYGDNIKIKQIIISIINVMTTNNNNNFIDFTLDTIIKYDVCRLIFTINILNYEMDLREINSILYEEKVLNLNNNTYNLDLVEIKNIIENLGGAFYISSRDGKTIIKVILDQMIYNDDQSLLLNEINTNLKYLNNKRKILVIDDNYQETQKISKYLRNNNYLVVVCLNNYDFENKVKNYNYDYVLLDDEFDGKTAIELCNKINTGKIIVMLSSEKKIISKYYLKQKKIKNIIFKENLIDEIKKILINK